MSLQVLGLISAVSRGAYCLLQFCTGRLIVHGTELSWTPDSVQLPSSYPLPSPGITEREYLCHLYDCETHACRNSLVCSLNLCPVLALLFNTAYHTFTVRRRASELESSIIHFQFPDCQNSIICSRAVSLYKMTLIDLSYKMGDKDRSIWPGNSPFVMKKVSEDDNNAMGCFIAHVSNDAGLRFKI